MATKNFLKKVQGSAAVRSVRMKIKKNRTDIKNKQKEAARLSRLYKRVLKSKSKQISRTIKRLKK